MKILDFQEERKSMMGLFGRSYGKRIFLPEGSNKESAQMLARTIEDLRTRLKGLTLKAGLCSHDYLFLAGKTTLTRSSSR